MRTFFSFTMSFFYKLYTYNFYQKIRKTFIYLHSQWIRNTFYKCDMSSHIGMNVSIWGGNKIEIGNHTGILDNCMIEAWTVKGFESKHIQIKIGDRCSIGEYCHLTSVNKIEIGNNVLTGRFVLISDNDHGTTDLEDLYKSPFDREIVSKGPVIIHDNVWIGDKVSILSGVEIGEGSVIAANSVVTNNVPAYCVVGGIPAKIIKSNK